MMEILGRLVKGDGVEEDLGALEDLSNAMIASSMCGLGQTAAVPVLDTLKYFRNDYETRISQSVFLRSLQPIEV
jgi:NADH:ubiquinone oxidoreductase subunit F (NADH-binding)